MNILKDLPRGVNGAMYADDLILWCTEESIGTAKNTYSIFTLSTRNHVANLQINGQQLRKEDTPTYLGVTLLMIRG